MSDVYDVFLSHASADKPAAQALARRLREDGLKAFLDKWDLVPGEPWQEALEDALTQSRTCAVVVGQAEMGPWHTREMRVAIGQQADNPSFRVIPVLLPGIRRPADAKLPSFLRQLTWVEFRTVPDDDEAYQRLVAGIRGEAPGPGTEGTARPSSTYRSMATPPDGFIHRQELDEVVALLTDAPEDAERSVGITTALRGAGGFGKTTLAQALAMDERVRSAFPDGVLWTTMGDDLRAGDRLTRIRDLLRAWTRDEPPAFETVSAAGTYLRDFLKGQRVLVIVDDVWSTADVEPFRGLGRGAALLITTRDRRTLPSECERVDVDAMRRAEAVKLLASGFRDAEDALFEPLAERLGEWPLLLKLVNRQVRRLVRDHDLTLAAAIERVERRLARGLEKLDVGHAEKREEAVGLTMQVSLDALSPADRERYLDLAVFPEDTDVPLDVLTRLWKLDEDETVELCERLVDLSLLLQLDLSAETIRLHDVFREYLLGQQDDQPGLHRSFLGQCCPGLWTNLDPDDGYLWRHLAYHLAAAGEEDVVLRQMLFDFSYLQAKLTATDVNALINDYEFLPGDGEERDVQGALRLAAHLLGRDFGHLDDQHLAGQLLGRLLGREGPGVGRLVGAAMRMSRLRPRYASLTRPGGPLLRTLEGHASRVSAVVVLDENRIISASDDQTLRIWDLASGETIRTLKGHTNGILAVAMLDENRVVSASHGKNLRVWEIASGETISTLKGHTDGVWAVAALDENRVVSASDDQTVRVWDLTSGETIRTLKGHNARVWAVAVVDENRVVSASDDQTLRVWDLTSGETIRTLKGHTDWVRAVAVLDENRVVSVSFDNTLRVWDLTSGETVRTLRGLSSVTFAVAVLDENRVASASFDALRVWDLTSGEMICTLKGHTNAVYAVAALDENRVVSASHDKTLRIWDLASGETTRSATGHTSRVAAVAVLDDNRVVSISIDGTLRVWDIASGEKIRTWKRYRSSRLVQVMALVDENRAVFASYDAKTLRVWDLTYGFTTRSLKGHTDQVVAVAVLDEDRVISASWDKTLRVWDIASGETIRTLTGHTSAVAAVAVVDENRVVSASRDALRVWDLTSGETIRTLKGHPEGFNAVAVVDENRVVSASRDHTLHVWDLTSGEPLCTLKGHTGRDAAVAVVDENHVVSASRDKTLRVWDVAAGRDVAVFTLDAPATAVACAVGRVVVAGDQVGGVHFLELVDSPSGAQNVTDS